MLLNNSLDNEYWVCLFGTNPNNNPTWDINDSITMEEIQNTVLEMKNNKAPGPPNIYLILIFKIQFHILS